MVRVAIQGFGKEPQQGALARTRLAGEERNACGLDQEVESGLGLPKLMAQKQLLHGQVFGKGGPVEPEAV